MPFKPGQSGNPSGRPKGAKDKLARPIKENIEKAFEELGGIEGLVEWGKKNNFNRAKLYGWYFSMLPSNVDADVSGNIGITLKKILTDERPEG